MSGHRKWSERERRRSGHDDPELTESTGPVCPIHNVMQLDFTADRWTCAGYDGEGCNFFISSESHALYQNLLNPSTVVSIPAPQEQQARGFPGDPCGSPPEQDTGGC